MSVRATDRVGLGILHVVAGVAGLGVLNVMVKVLAARYPVVEITFFRSLFALPPAALMVMAAGGWATIRTAHPWGHVWRGVCGMVAMSLTFWSYELLPLADAVAIGFSSPLFMTALSGPLLGERVGVWRWGAVVLGFAGVLIVAGPDGTHPLGSGSLVALGAAAGFALTMITIRRLGRTEKPTTIVFWFMVSATLLSALPLPFVWITPSAEDFAVMVATGLCGGMTQYLVTRAYLLAPASVIGPFNYTAILWASLFGWLFWGTLPGPNVAIGSAMVVASGLVILWRETRRVTRA